jgi:hypothetical protein
MKRVNPTRCLFCVGGLVYDGAPDATGTPSYQCDSCNGTGNSSSEAKQRAKTHRVARARTEQSNQPCF